MTSEQILSFIKKPISADPITIHFLMPRISKLKFLYSQQDASRFRNWNDHWM